MKLTHFKQHYANIFADLGNPLSTEHQLPAQHFLNFEQKHQCKLPEALKSFYRIAGQATGLTDVHDRFLSPAEWEIDSDKLIFFEENQAVVLYGIMLNAIHINDDPPVFIATNHHSGLEWHEVCRSSSEFISTMLYFHATFGEVLPYVGSAVVPETIKHTLNRHWQYIGEVNAMHAYAQPGRALCYLQWGEDWMVFAGAVNQLLFITMKSDLNISLSSE